MIRRQFIGLAVLALGVSLLAGVPARAQRKKSADMVKVTAKADKPGEDGKQVVTVTLDVEKGWYLYANPVGNKDFEDNRTEITVKGKGKVETVSVDYPAGKKKADKVVGDYQIYTGQVTVKAVVKRAKGDDGPLSVSVKVQACQAGENGVCLLPGTVEAPVQ